MSPTDLLVRNIIDPNATKLERFLDRAWFMIMAVMVTATLLQAIPS
jgi:hypothetical protein